MERQLYIKSLRPKITHDVTPFLGHNNKRHHLSLHLFSNATSIESTDPRIDD